MKICIHPNFHREDNADGGIRRVVEAQIKHLPDFGFEIVDDDKKADVVACHGASISKATHAPVIAHCHGLYWAEDEWAKESWVDSVNRMVVENMRRAEAITVPSEWVRNAIAYGLHARLNVVHHGVDPDEWKPSRTKGKSVVWNKARLDVVSNPADMNAVAKLMPEIDFVSTFGVPADNVKITGAMSVHNMKEMVRNAGVYLVTTEETFGIGTLEALSCGVPVVGWDIGGQSDIIKNGITGRLVRKGNFSELAEAIRECLENRKRFGQNARDDVLKNWTWPGKIEKYAQIYHEAIDSFHSSNPKVSVIVTCYNYGRFLIDCLTSVQRQTLENWECIIVDDGSTDNSIEVAENFCRSDKRFKLVRTSENSKTPGARNIGFENSKGKYFIPLDADDCLSPTALETLSGELDRDTNISIAYGHLDAANSDLSEKRRGDWPPDTFSWERLVMRQCPMPYSSMMRRRVMENLGGYRKREIISEDAELWCRATSYGYHAKKVTNASTLIYRMHGKNKTAQNREGNWTIFLPFVEKTSIKPGLVPFGSQGNPPASMIFWKPKKMTNPTVSVIIPVGPGHEKLVIDAIESINAQTRRDFEIIVVNDTGNEWNGGFSSPVAGAPYVRVVTTGGVMGVAFSRNTGAQYANGSMLLFLDADDYLVKNAIEEMMKHSNGETIIYSDWIENTYPEAPRVHRSSEFIPGEVLQEMKHAVTALVPKKYHEAIGGFDTQLEGWEDWDYYIAMQTIGVCSKRVPVPLFVYRILAGRRRNSSFANKDKLLQSISGKWTEYFSGEKLMASCKKCGGKKKAVVASQEQATPMASAAVQTTQNGSTLLRYNGKTGPLNYKGKITGTTYRFGPDENHRQKYVFDQDVPGFLALQTSGGPLFSVV